MEAKSWQKNTSPSVKIVALDPGVMSGLSHMVAGGQWLFKILQTIFTFLGPILQMADKSAINPPLVPARMIAALFGKAEGMSLAREVICIG